MTREGIAWVLLLGIPTLVIFTTVWRVFTETRLVLVGTLLAALALVGVNEFYPGRGTDLIRFLVMATILFVGGFLYFWLRVAPRLITEDGDDTDGIALSVPASAGFGSASAPARNGETASFGLRPLAPVKSGSVDGLKPATPAKHDAVTGPPGHG